MFVVSMCPSVHHECTELSWLGSVQGHLVSAWGHLVQPLSVIETVFSMIHFSVECFLASLVSALSAASYVIARF